MIVNSNRLQVNQSSSSRTRAAGFTPSVRTAGREPRIAGRTTFHQNRRTAFTLVELMVAMALIVFIMTILSAAFASASKTFRDLKAAGDLAERLRSATTLLRRDLSSPHFDPSTKKLSDFDFWSSSNGPPLGGFVRILQAAEPTTNWVTPQPTQGAIQIPTGIRVANNTFSLPNEIPTFVNSQSLLHFTVVLPGLMPNDFFSTNVGANNCPPIVDPTGTFSSFLNQDRRYQNPTGTVFNSQYAEVVWALVPTNSNPSFTLTDNTAVNPPQQLFALMRRQRLLWPESSMANVPVPLTNLNEVSVPMVNIPSQPPPNSTVPVSRMSDITAPAFRWNSPMMSFPVYPNPPVTSSQATDSAYAGASAVSSFTSPGQGVFSTSDIVIDYVLSFSVRVLLWNYASTPPSAASDFVDLSDPSVQAFANNNKAFSQAAPLLCSIPGRSKILANTTTLTRPLAGPVRGISQASRYFRTATGRTSASWRSRSRYESTIPRPSSPVR